MGGRSAIRRRRHLSYTLWVGDGEWEDMAETILSWRRVANGKSGSAGNDMHRANLAEANRRAALAEREAALNGRGVAAGP
jgi:hypothetical protein